MATIPVRFARERIARLPLQATARQALIARAGIPPGLLDVDGPRVAPPAYRRLNRLAVAAGDDEYLGYLARPVPPGTMAQMLRLLAYLPDLDAAATEAGRVIGLFDGAPPWAVEHDRADGRGRIRLLASRGVQADSLLFAHIQLLGLIHVLGWLAGETVPVQRVILPAAFAEHAAESRFLFGRAVEHHPGDSAAIVFGPGALARPVIARPDTAGSFARRLIDRMGSQLFTSIAMSGAGPAIVIHFLLTHPASDLAVPVDALPLMLAIGTPVYLGAGLALTGLALRDRGTA